MHIERRTREKIVTGVLVVATAVLSAFGAELILRPDIKPRASEDIAGSLPKPPGPETVSRSSESYYKALKIPPLPYQR